MSYQFPPPTSRQHSGQNPSQMGMRPPPPPPHDGQDGHHLNGQRPLSGGKMSSASYDGGGYLPPPHYGGVSHGHGPHGPPQQLPPLHIPYSYSSYPPHPSPSNYHSQQAMSVHHGHGPPPPQTHSAHGHAHSNSDGGQGGHGGSGSSLGPGGYPYKQEFPQRWMSPPPLHQSSHSQQSHSSHHHHLPPHLPPPISTHTLPPPQQQSSQHGLPHPRSAPVEFPPPDAGFFEPMDSYNGAGYQRMSDYRDYDDMNMSRSYPSHPSYAPGMTRSSSYSGYGTSLPPPHSGSSNGAGAGRNQDTYGGYSLSAASGSSMPYSGTSNPPSHQHASHPPPPPLNIPLPPAAEEMAYSPAVEKEAGYFGRQLGNVNRDIMYSPSTPTTPLGSLSLGSYPPFPDMKGVSGSTATGNSSGQNGSYAHPSGSISIVPNAAGTAARKGAVPRRKKTTLTELAHCTRCNSTIATLILHGTPETLSQPHVIDMRCLACEFGMDVAMETRVAPPPRRRRKRVQVYGPGAELDCDVCMRRIGSGGVRRVQEYGYEGYNGQNASYYDQHHQHSPSNGGGGFAQSAGLYGGNGAAGGTGGEMSGSGSGSGGGHHRSSQEWVEPQFEVEVICVSCHSKYALCTECGGGGTFRTGKWRPRELFPKGRKTCSLSHLRVGSNAKMEIYVWKLIEEVCMPIEEPPREKISFVDQTGQWDRRWTPTAAGSASGPGSGSQQQGQQGHSSPDQPAQRYVYGTQALPLLLRELREVYEDGFMTNLAVPTVMESLPMVSTWEKITGRFERAWHEFMGALTRPREGVRIMMAVAWMKIDNDGRRYGKKGKTAHHGVGLRVAKSGFASLQSSGVSGAAGDPIGSSNGHGNRNAMIDWESMHRTPPGVSGASEYRTRLLVSFLTVMWRMEDGIILLIPSADRGTDPTPNGITAELLRRVIGRTRADAALEGLPDVKHLWCYMRNPSATALQQHSTLHQTTTDSPPPPPTALPGGSGGSSGTWRAAGILGRLGMVPVEQYVASLAKEFINQTERMPDPRVFDDEFPAEIREYYRVYGTGIADVERVLQRGRRIVEG
ncbi:hypothetical protein BC832DRAFT_588938 [Gaertneriomyces semiglobifer]|nr:hypothetical protein BC832DRAFT_588938 [Gaertneriomyces semiglobifer]